MEGARIFYTEGILRCPILKVIFCSIPGADEGLLPICFRYIYFGYGDVPSGRVSSLQILVERTMLILTILVSGKVPIFLDFGIKDKVG